MTKPINSHEIELGRLEEITEAAVDAIRTEFRRYGSLHCSPPALGAITGACEQIPTTYKVIDRHDGLRYVLQTAQLYLEACLVDHRSTSCVIYSGRDETSDKRHLTGFQLAEEEATWDKLGARRDDDILDRLCVRIEDVVRSTLSALSESPDLMGVSQSERLRMVTGLPWPRISYDEALSAVLTEVALDASPHDFNAIDEEAIIAEFSPGQTAVPIFVQRYPREIKFFNMRRDRSRPERVLSVDMLLPGAGEAVGGAVREENADFLQESLGASSMLRQHLDQGGNKADFDAYVTLMRSGTVPPHAGYGLGVERLLQFALDLPDIRMASALLRRSRQIDWAR